MRSRERPRERRSSLCGDRRPRPPAPREVGSAAPVPAAVPVAVGPADGPVAQASLRPRTAPPRHGRRLLSLHAAASVVGSCSSRGVSAGSPVDATENPLEQLKRRRGHAVSLRSPRAATAESHRGLGCAQSPVASPRASLTGPASGAAERVPAAPSAPASRPGALLLWRRLAGVTRPVPPQPRQPWLSRMSPRSALPPRFAPGCPAERRTPDGSFPSWFCSSSSPRRFSSWAPPPAALGRKPGETVAVTGTVTPPGWVVGS